MKRKQPPSTRATLLVVVLVLAAAWLSGLFWFVRGVDGMQPPAGAQPLDAIIVLTGGTKRLDTGFDLLKKGMGKKMFISGVYRGVEARELMKLSRQESEEKLSCCVALGNAGNTIENAQETSVWMKGEAFKSFYLVTANYHMKRALAEFRHIAPDFDAVPWPVAPQQVDMKKWWQDGAIRALIIREYVKYLLASARHLVML